MHKKCRGEVTLKVKIRGKLYLFKLKKVRKNPTSCPENTMRKTKFFSVILCII
jgi:hypothetical protein